MTLIVKDTLYRINFTFSLTVTFMLLLCSENTVILCLVSSILHEIGHLFFMRIFHQKVESVTFGAFGVRIQRHSGGLSYKKEAAIAIGGILVNFFIAIFSYLYYYLWRSDFALKLIGVNIIIALFNMIPIDVLDMGRVIRYILLSFVEENLCDRILKIVSVIFVNLLAILCIYYSIFISINISLITVTLYLYIITLIKKWS